MGEEVAETVEVVVNDGGVESASAVKDEVVEIVDVVPERTATENEPKRELTESELAEKKAEREREIEEAMSCPCIDGMKSGPCGDPFIAAYRCFLESESEPRGSDCYDQFVAMHNCIQEHPEAFNTDDDEDPFEALGSDNGGEPTTDGPRTSDTEQPQSTDTPMPTSNPPDAESGAAIALESLKESATPTATSTS